MISSSDLRGLVGMVPAFTTEDGWDPHARNTVNVGELERAVDRIICDGMNVVAPMATSGECYTLLWDEFKTMTDVTIAAANKRVPVMIGCTSTNTREALEKMDYAEKAGADGVLVGVPYYYPSSTENAVQFYHDLADAFPRLGIMIYHNPYNHRVTIPVDAFKKLIEKPNIVAMKDSHRTPMQFMNLQEIVRGKISVFVNQVQLYPYMMMGAAGCWSLNAFMGPSPIVRALQAADAKNWDEVKEICMAMAKVSPRGDRGDAYASKLAINEAGYCYAGPPRPPYRILKVEAKDRGKEMAKRWRALCERYPDKIAAVA
jgi:dihydrodipicolinate synthase/N-acetylneuraminate lyase